MKTIKILIVDDHAILRAGLKMLINNEKDMKVIGEAETGKDAIEKYKMLLPDIVLMDITLPDMNGLVATKEIKKFNKDCKVIVLTMHDDSEYLKEFLKIGVLGYVLKKAADNELVNAIRIVNQGELFIYPSLAKSLREILNEDEKVLSQREKEVLLLLVKGHTNKEIANLINLSVKTVETYRARITEKLGLASRAELVQFAIKKGWFK